jgi:hypothetical protein
LSAFASVICRSSSSSSSSSSSRQTKHAACVNPVTSSNDPDYTALQLFMLRPHVAYNGLHIRQSCLGMQAKVGVQHSRHH